MSYSRWSSDRWTCDLFVFESIDGYEVHVTSAQYVCAGILSPRDVASGPLFRLGLGEPYAGCFGDGSVPEELLEPIGGPHDGETFVEPDAIAAWLRVRALYESGYRGTPELLPNLYLEAMFEHSR